MRFLILALVVCSFVLPVQANTFAPSEGQEIAQKKVKKKKRRRRKKRKKSLHDQVTGQGYGVAGCGLGSIVFGAEPGMIQIVAATLNGTGYQTFGITTGTSNCDIPHMGAMAAQYIEVNRETVAKEAAQGSGETISGLANIFKCSDFGQFNQKMKSEYGTVFAPKNDSYEVSRQIIRVIKSDQNLSATCAELG